MESSDFMTVKECAELLKISTTTIYRLVRKGNLPGAKIGNQWRFSRGLIKKHVEGNIEKRR